jgi:RND superfamily putative drug exporter
MFETVGHLVFRSRRAVLIATVILVAAAAVFGVGVFGKLKGGGFDDPGSESSRAEDVLRDRFGTGEPNFVLLVTARDGSVDSPDAVAAGRLLTEQLQADPSVRTVASYWQTGSDALRNEAGDKALVLARIDGRDDDEIQDRYDEIAPTVEGDHGAVAGSTATFSAISDTVKEDLAKAESIAVPITLVLLLLVFGTVVAAGLPLLVGLVAIVGTLVALSVIGSLTDVSIFSINLTTALGLGLAIDYSLFIVSRFREELHKGGDVEQAIVKTVMTAGRTVAFSGLTVAASLCALLVFPLYFLRSFAYAGVAVVAVAVLASIVSLPALLAVLGPRIDSWRLLKRKPAEEGTGFWHRMATWVMHRPVRVTVAVVALLVALGLPFLGVKFGLADDRVLPSDAAVRRTSDVLRDEFTSNEGNAFDVAVVQPVDDGALATWSQQISAIAGVSRVDTRLGSFAVGRKISEPTAQSARFEGGDAGTYVSVVPTVEPVSPEGEHVVHAIRDLDPPFETLVGGRSAALVDTKSAIVDRLPIAIAIIAVITFGLLFLMFGSIVVPLKALVLNLLSLTATFGAMVWVFQDGHGSHLLDFTATGTLNTTTPILMFCIAFGLSMDYEVFLLSRIKEEHDLTHDNTHSVAMGLERTGRIVTAAAALLAVTFIAFGTSNVSFIKLFGLGLALAIVMDATIVRATLVPALMRLAGELNWWAPTPLRRFYERYGIHEAVEVDRSTDEHVDKQPVLHD